MMGFHEFIMFYIELKGEYKVSTYCRVIKPDIP